MFSQITFVKFSFFETKFYIFHQKTCAKLDQEGLRNQYVIKKKSYLGCEPNHNHDVQLVPQPTSSNTSFSCQNCPIRLRKKVHAGIRIDQQRIHSQRKLIIKQKVWGQARLNSQWKQIHKICSLMAPKILGRNSIKNL